MREFLSHAAVLKREKAVRFGEFLFQEFLSEGPHLTRFIDELSKLKDCQWFCNIVKELLKGTRCIISSKQAYLVGFAKRLNVPTLIFVQSHIFIQMYKENVI